MFKSLIHCILPLVCASVEENPFDANKLINSIELIKGHLNLRSKKITNEQLAEIFTVLTTEPYQNKIIGIDLSSNLITKLSPNSFKKMGNLKSLTLSFNKIETIEKGVFHKIPSNRLPAFLVSL